MTKSDLPTWTKEYETGVKAIDSDHKALFQEIKLLAMTLMEHEGDKEIDQAITCLENYVHEHFRREESFMIHAGYPGTEEHIKAHKALRRKVALLRMLHHDETATIDPLQIVVFLQNWLSNHILNVDMASVPYLHGEREGRDENLVSKLHEVNIHVPDNMRKTVEDFMLIISSDLPIASELIALIEQFEKRLEEHELADARATFCVN